MTTFLHDLRHAARMLRKEPGFAAVTVLTMALGIGANTAIFSVVNAVLLRPLPYRDADRLMVAGLSLPDYRDLRNRSSVFDETAVWASNLYRLEDEEPEQVRGATVSPGFFRLLGQPALGRAFAPDEERARVAVLSAALWRRRFGADPSVLGRTIRLSGEPYRVVGVAAAEFEFPEASFDLWVPMGAAMERAPEQAEDRSLRIFHVVGRLRPGIAIERARAEGAALSRALQREHPDTNVGVEIDLEPLNEQLLGEVRPALFALLAAVGLVLAIACANVANLLLARSAARGREMGVRAALGAGRGRIARQLLTESLLLAVLGGAAGLALAAWAIDLLPRLGASDLPRLRQVSIDGRVLFFTLGASLATGILFGLAPATLAWRSLPARSLHEDPRTSTGGSSGRRLRGGLVVGEVALALIVVAGAGLLVQSLGRLLREDPGFASQGLLAANLELFQIGEPARRAVALDAVIERVRELPGVLAAGAGTGLPPQTAQRATGFEIEGLPPEPEGLGGYFLAVTPAYFRTMGTSVLAGRAFEAWDRAGAAPVVIVNRSLTRRLFPGADPVGRRLRLVSPEQSPEWRTIVGVVEDVRYSGLDDPGESAVYVPFAQAPFLWAYLMVRTDVPPRALARSLREAVAGVDPRLVPALVQPLEEVVSEAVAGRRFHTLLLTAFGMLALVLAAVGVYGVAACGVTQRTREIGVRVALGARTADVLRLVVGGSLRLALVGVAIGTVGALASGRLLQGLLYGVGPTDPVTFATVAALLAGVVTFASYLPARRAAGLDPLRALRSE